jgi:5-methylcytosine-specific restriction endonuclease McrA
MVKKRRMRTSWLFAARITGNFPFDFHFFEHVRTNQIQCSYCGKFFPLEEMTRDHIYPKSLEGTYTTPCCNPCNIAKENMLPIQWAIFATENDIAFGKEWVPKGKTKKNSDYGDVNG